MEQQLRREGGVASAFLALDSARESIDEAADRLAELLKVRVTLISPDGRVLGDSGLGGEDLARVENHSGRPEVREALEPGSGKAIRYSATVHTNYMYVTTRVNRKISVTSRLGGGSTFTIRLPQEPSIRGPA